MSKLKRDCLSLSPIKVTKHTWYYEEKNKLSVVHEVYQDKHLTKVVTIDLPIRLLKNSLKKYQTKARRG